MNIKKIQLVLALGLNTTILTGCATMPIVNRPIEQTATKKYATIKEATEVLRVGPGMIYLNLPDGYKASRLEEGNLKTLAGIYAGTVNVKKIEDGYVAEGSYSLSQNPDAMEKALKEADTNKDKIVTGKEVRDLAARLCEKNSKK